ncbi:Uncharacterized protein HZ326_26758 [Fusarium oxysporum f. sp. albedinis]|nr:Uncharacterized protein HZ326_26758 [Fusarium oxysporum f. sp. albedinis]
MIRRALLLKDFLEDLWYEQKGEWEGISSGPDSITTTFIDDYPVPKTVAKQLEEAAVAALPPNPTIEDLPNVIWKNRRFVQEDSRARKSDQPIGHVWCCNQCNMKGTAEFFSLQATSSAVDHLRKHAKWISVTWRYVIAEDLDRPPDSSRT